MRRRLARMREQRTFVPVSIPLVIEIIQRWVGDTAPRLLHRALPVRHGHAIMETSDDQSARKRGVVFLEMETLGEGFFGAFEALDVLLELSEHEERTAVLIGLAVGISHQNEIGASRGVPPVSGFFAQNLPLFQCRCDALGQVVDELL